MKTKYILRNTTTAVLALLLSGCVAEDVTESKPSSSSNGKVMKFSAIMENNDNNVTRTTLGTDGKTVLWKSHDQIKVFNAEITGASAAFTNEAEEASSSTDFTGTISADADGNGDFYALYPYQEDATYTDNVLTAELPTIQTATEGSFDPAAQLMTGHTGATYFKFKNVVALIKVTIKSSTSEDGFQIGAIRFTANKSTEKIAGGFSASIDAYGVPTVTANNASTGSQSVVLKVDDNGTKLDDGTYYIAVLPSTYSTGFSLYLEDIRSGHKKLYKRSRKTAYTINRSDIINMGTYNGDDIDDTEDIFDEYIDLGLPSGTLWCSSNVGSTYPFEVGDYYAWGEDTPRGKDVNTQNSANCGKYFDAASTASINCMPKLIYSWASYKYGHGSSRDQNIFNSDLSINYGKLGKYNSSKNYMGTIDNLTELITDVDDAAYQENTNHIMPTYTQIEELISNCTISSLMDYPYKSLFPDKTFVQGFKITSNVSGYTDKWIWLPAGGLYYYDSSDASGPTPLKESNAAAYWSRTRASKDTKSYQARTMDINRDNSDNQDDRMVGRNIRPVIKK